MMRRSFGFSPMEQNCFIPQSEPDAELDLRGIICPYNFVKTKLKLETMDAGEVLAVILDDGEPIINVPQSIINEGHTVLSQQPFSDSYRVMIRKRFDV